jgi:hypothetical protein
LIGGRSRSARPSDWPGFFDLNDRARIKLLVLVNGHDPAILLLPQAPQEHEVNFKRADQPEAIEWARQALLVGYALFPLGQAEKLEAERRRLRRRTAIPVQRDRARRPR